MRVLSGIQPTGRIHWGNYFGAIRQYIDLQDNERGVLLHRQSARADHGPRCRASCGSTRSTRRSTCWRWGSIPNKATLFVQSDVPEVSELCWLLMTGTPMGLLERCSRLQGQEGEGADGRRRAVHVSGAAGGRHSGLRHRHGAGRRGPGAAHRGLPRPGRQLQPPVRQTCS